MGSIKINDLKLYLNDVQIPTDSPLNDIMDCHNVAAGHARSLGRPGDYEVRVGTTLFYRVKIRERIFATEPVESEPEPEQPEPEPESPIILPGSLLPSLGMRHDGHGLHNPTLIADIEADLGAPLKFWITDSSRDGYSYMDPTQRPSFANQIGNRTVVLTIRLGWGFPSGEMQPDLQDGIPVPDPVKRELRRAEYKAIVEDKKWDDRHLKFARQIAKNHKNAILRIGHEDNANWKGGWFAGVEEEYKLAFRHVVDLYRSVSEDFRIDWNMSRKNYAATAIPAYPGREWVDIHGLDGYFQERLMPIIDQPYYKDHRDLALAMRRPISFPEYAVWKSDNVQGLIQFFQVMRLAQEAGLTIIYHSYFNVIGKNGDAGDRHSFAKYQLTGAEYKELIKI